MKFVIDIPDEYIIATAGKIIRFGPDTTPPIEECLAEIQNYFDTPYNKVKRENVKQADPEVLAIAAEIELKKEEYAAKVAEKSGTPKDAADTGVSAIAATKI